MDRWPRWRRWGDSRPGLPGSNDGGPVGRGIDPGTMEFWQAGAMPPIGANGVNSGTMEFWQAGNMPPVITVV